MERVGILISFSCSSLLSTAIIILPVAAIEILFVNRMRGITLYKSGWYFYRWFSLSLSLSPPPLSLFVHFSLSVSRREATTLAPFGVRANVLINRNNSMECHFTLRTRVERNANVVLNVVHFSLARQLRQIACTNKCTFPMTSNHLFGSDENEMSATTRFNRV